MTSPNGGETWEAGTAQNIMWTSTGSIGVVDIVCVKGGVEESFIATNAPNGGSFTWDIPPELTPGEDYRICITGSSASPSDESDADFTIEGACIYKTLFLAEWPLIAAHLELNDSIVDNPGEGIPLRWGLAMVRTVLCNPEHPHHDNALSAYLANIQALENEEASVAAMVEPYKHVLAALLLTNRNKQNRYKAMFGLQNDYQVVRLPQSDSSDELFSDNGDLDEDGLTNSQEYENVIASGGSMEAFAEAVSNGSLNGAAVPGAGLFALVLLTSALVTGLMLRAGKIERHS